MLFQKAFWTAQIFTVMLFYCSYYQNVLVTQWVMLMLFSSILKPYKASCDRISGVGKPRLLKHLGCYIRQGLSHSKTLAFVDVLLGRVDFK